MIIERVGGTAPLWCFALPLPLLLLAPAPYLCVLNGERVVARHLCLFLCLAVVPPLLLRCCCMQLPLYARAAAAVCVPFCGRSAPPPP